MVTTDDRGFVKYWQSNFNNVHTFQAHAEPVKCSRWDSTSAGHVTRHTASTGVVSEHRCTCTESRFCGVIMIIGGVKKNIMNKFENGELFMSYCVTNNIAWSVICMDE